ncbi:MAG: hypothetical protein M3P39_02930, partial [Actinomycetota bacterium]|nr:hypothetical protein [Actinomycetota bacterium]
VREAVAGDPGVVVIAGTYADAARVPAGPLPPRLLPLVARAAGVGGCLLDTAIKDGTRLFDWIAPEALAALVAEAQDGGLEVALAGALSLDDLPAVRATGADLAGVRSAACLDGVRSAALDAQRVHELCAACAA